MARKKIFPGQANWLNITLIRPLVMNSAEPEGGRLSLHRALRVARKHITNNLESLDSGSSVPWSLYRAGSVASMGCEGSFHLSPVTKRPYCTGKHIASHKTGYSAMLQ